MGRQLGNREDVRERHTRTGSKVAPPKCQKMGGGSGLSKTQKPLRRQVESKQEKTYVPKLNFAVGGKAETRTRLNTSV